MSGNLPARGARLGGAVAAEYGLAGRDNQTISAAAFCISATIVIGCARSVPRSSTVSMRQWALFALKFAVSAALLYLATRRIQIDTIGERLNQLVPGWLVLAIAIGLLQTGLGAVRWQRIASLCGAAMPQSQAVRFGMIAAFFNQVLPSTVGGDAARIVLAARAGNGWRKATYSVLLDRFIGLLALAMIVTAGLYWSFG